MKSTENNVLTTTLNIQREILAELKEQTCLLKQLLSDLAEPGNDAATLALKLGQPQPK